MSNRGPEHLPLRARAWILAIGSVCALAAASVIVVTVLYSQPPRMLPPSEAVVNLGMQISEMPSGEAIRFAAPAGVKFEMVDGGGNNRTGEGAAVGWFVHTNNDFLALAADSSHLGCLVMFDDRAAQFQDPCGGSLFALNGAVLHGPAAFPLSHLRWRQAGPNSIAVQTTATPG